MEEIESITKSPVLNGNTRGTFSPVRHSAKPRQGSHTSWKTWKMANILSMHGKLMENGKKAKTHGKLMEN